jgi:hypothetical protein
LKPGAVGKCWLGITDRFGDSGSFFTASRFTASQAKVFAPISLLS